MSVFFDLNKINDASDNLNNSSALQLPSLKGDLKRKVMAAIVEGRDSVKLNTKKYSTQKSLLSAVHNGLLEEDLENGEYVITDKLKSLVGKV